MNVALIAEVQPGVPDLAIATQEVHRIAAPHAATMPSGTRQVANVALLICVARQMQARRGKSKLHKT